VAFFEAAGDRPHADLARTMAVKLAGQIAGFQTAPLKDGGFFLTLHSDRRLGNPPFGNQPADGLGNLYAVAHLDPLADRTALYDLVSAKYPIEFFRKPDSTRMGSEAETMPLPSWCMSANRIGGNPGPLKAALRSRADYLIGQARMLEGGGNGAPRYVFRVADYGLTILAILSELGPPSQLPDLPFRGTNSG
jgi:hypothetical protein